MAYLCDLGSEQSVYLENVHQQTLVTIASSHPGQQQQSSNGFQTGAWTAPPEVFRAAIGTVVRLHTHQGEWFVLIQGTRLSVSKEAPSWTEAQPLPVQSVAQNPGASMPPMPSIAPMQPMTMGNMQMNRHAMSAQMGNMQMNMGAIAQSPSAPSQSTAVGSDTTDGQRKFCSQCGTAIKPSDRFCAHCGHRLD